MSDRPFDPTKDPGCLRGGCDRPPVLQMRQTSIADPTDPDSFYLVCDGHIISGLDETIKKGPIVVALMDQSVCTA